MPPTHMLAITSQGGSDTTHIGHRATHNAQRNHNRTFVRIEAIKARSVAWPNDAQMFRFELELELELIQPHMTQKPVLRGEVGASVRVIRACGQRRERRSGRARWCKAPG